MKILVLLTALLVSLSASAAEPDAFDKILASGTLRCGYAISPPFTNKDPNSGALSGLQYEIVNEMGRRMDLKVEWVVEAAFGTAVADIQAGKYDVFCSGLNPTAVRGKFVAFTDAPFLTPWYVWVRADEKRFAGGLDELNAAGVRMGIVTGTSLVSIKAQLFPNATAEEIQSIGNENVDLLLALSTGKIDFTITDRQIAEGFMQGNPGTIRSLLPNPVWVVPFSFAVAKDNYKLRDALNTALLEMKTSGGLDRILDSHKKDIPFILRPPKLYRD